MKGLISRDLGNGFIACLMAIFLFAAPANGEVGTEFFLTGEGGLPYIDILFTAGEYTQGYLSQSMAVGDFNGDNIDDLALGAPKDESGRGISEAGAVSLFFGSTGFTSIASSSKHVVVPGRNGPESSVIEGINEYDHVGELMAAGDLNGDGLDDLVIVAQKGTSRPEQARIYILFGKATAAFPSQISLGTNGDQDVEIQRIYDDLWSTSGETLNKIQVASLACGDLNGDGKDDLVIADDLVNNSSQTAAPSGAVHVIYGKSSFPATINLATESDVTITLNGGESEWNVEGVTTGDFNNDGKSDIAVGSPDESMSSPPLNSNGKVYLFYGGTLSGSLAPSNADVVISGALDDEQVGGALAAGDLNADGVDDLVIGAPRSGWGITGTTGKGIIYVVFGNSGLASSLDLYTDKDVELKVESAQIGWYTGQALAVKDMNGDGNQDLVIGVPGAFLNRSNNGFVYVLYCGPQLSGYYALDSAADLAFYAPDPTDPLTGGRMGWTVAAGDFNDDGKADLVMGAYESGYGGLTAGFAAVVMNPSDLSGGTTDAGCATLNALGQLYIPCVDLSAISPVSISLTLKPDALFYNWTILPNGVGVAENTESCVPLVIQPSWRLDIPCADLSVLGSNWGNWKVGFDINTQTYTFTLDMSATAPL